MLGLAAFGGSLGRLRQRQVDGHRRMIGHAIVHGLVQFAHGNREVGSEPKTLSRTSRFVNEGLPKHPVKLETSHQSSKVSAESVGTGETLP
jgi:hypothetical protein